MNKFLFTSTLKRFSLAVILAVCAMTSAFAQNAGEITLKMENAPLGKVMDAIEISLSTCSLMTASMSI